MNQKLPLPRILLTLSLVQVSAKGADPIDEVVSYYNGHCVNCNAWRQFDMLMQVESVADTGTRQLFSEVSLTRYIVDFDRSHLFVASESKYMEGAGAQAQSEEAVRLCGMVTNGKSSRKFVFPGRVHSYTNSFQAGLAALKIPDPRCVGLAAFPVEFYTDPAAPGFERIVASGQLLIPAATSFPSKQTVKFEIERELSLKTQRGLSVTNYEYRLDTLMPERHAVQISLETPAGTKTFPQFTETYQWSEMKNIFVPKRILRDSVGFYEARAGSTGLPGVKDGERYNLETTVTFHWFSLNEPLEDGRFALNALDDIAELSKLLDPKQSKADTLLAP